MATFMCPKPPELTGDSNMDVSAMNEWSQQLYSSVAHCMQNLDEDNFTEDIIKKLGGVNSNEL